MSSALGIVGTRDEIRVLLVEDNSGDAELVAEQLSDRRSAHLSVVHVDRLSTALAALRGEGFDAVLLDLGLPDSTGINALQRVLEAHGNLPVVVLTGLDDAEAGTLAVQAGAQDFVTKGSYQSGSLMKTLLYAIERSRWQQQTLEMVAKNVDAMIVVSVEGIIMHVNRAAERLFEKAASDLVGELFNYSLEDKSTAEIEIPRAHGQEVRFAQMRVAQIDWRGDPAYLASLRDITDLKRAQELEQRLLHADRLASIGQLAAGVAHEINNPSAFVQANIEILAETVTELQEAHAEIRKRVASDLGEEAGASVDELYALHKIGERHEAMLEMLADSLSGTHRISSTVKELASFSRIERGEIESVDVNDVVEVACNMAHNEIRHRAHLTKELEPLPIIAGDRAKLIHVVINLLVNAAQAIGEGAPEQNRITVTTGHREGFIHLTVMDTGCGMSPHQLRQAFEPFFTTKPREQGTGLGLSISAESVRTHGGEIIVSSELGKGTRFEIVLPVTTGLETTVPNVGTDESRPATRSRGRVLLIDDEKMLRKAMRRVLEPLHVVVEASSGDEALEVLASEGWFDVIVCDLMMPDTDGPLLHERVRELYPTLLDRFVFVTGGAFTSRAKAFIADTQPLVLEKPISAADLLDVIARVLTTTTTH